VKQELFPEIPDKVELVNGDDNLGTKKWANGLG
jgi:hypothetical protein